MRKDMLHKDTSHWFDEINGTGLTFSNFKFSQHNQQSTKTFTILRGSLRRKQLLSLCFSLPLTSTLVLSLSLSPTSCLGWNKLAFRQRRHVFWRGVLTLLAWLGLPVRDLPGRAVEVIKPNLEPMSLTALGSVQGLHSHSQRCCSTFF